MTYLAGIFVLFGLIAIVMWQVYAVIFRPDQTISLFAEKLNKVNPLIGYIIAVIFGILIGHWFIPPGGM